MSRPEPIVQNIPTGADKHSLGDTNFVAEITLGCFGPNSETIDGGAEDEVNCTPMHVHASTRMLSFMLSHALALSVSRGCGQTGTHVHTHANMQKDEALGRRRAAERSGDECTFLK